MNRNVIKYIAIVAMLMDHLAKLLVSVNTPLYFAMRFVGRLTAPIMCYFLAEGYRYTSSKFKYGKRLLIFGLISQIPYALTFHNKILTPNFNMILTLFICFIILYVYDNVHNYYFKWIIILCLIALTTYFDWIYFAPIFVLIFYIFKSDQKKQLISYSIVSLIAIVYLGIEYGLPSGRFFKQFFQFGLFLFVPVILMYNGKPGVKNAFNKWFFYIIYPAHLIAIWGITKII